jgi:hypothetical protein
LGSALDPAGLCSPAPAIPFEISNPKCHISRVPIPETTSAEACESYIGRKFGIKATRKLRGESFKRPWPRSSGRMRAEKPGTGTM